jgi:hypothetical protein
MAVLALAALAVHRALRKYYWRKTGAETSLTADGGTIGPRAFSGTIGGHDVRAVRGRTSEANSTSDGNKQEYTLLEAALSSEAADGVVVGPTDQDGDGFLPFDVAGNADAQRDGVAAVSNREGLAEAVLTDRVVAALGDLDELDQGYVGNVAAVSEAIADEEWATDRYYTWPRVIDSAHDDDRPRGDWLGGRGYVNQLATDTVLDSDELERRAEAVAAVTDAFESVTRE